MTTTTSKEIKAEYNNRPTGFEAEGYSYCTTRPDFVSDGEIPSHDEEGNRLILPVLKIINIEVEMPKLGSPNLHWQLADHSDNDWPVNMGYLTQIRGWLTGTVNPECFTHKNDYVLTPTYSEDIVSLWFLHHRGEVAAEACMSYGSLPIKMHVDFESAVASAAERGRRSREVDNEAIAYSYTNLWNYTVGRNNELYPIKQTEGVDWINNLEAHTLTQRYLNSYDNE